MKAQVLYGINDLRCEADYPNPTIHEEDLLVKIAACGICGSDINRVLNTGAYFSPAIIGHEFSGVVVKTARKEDESYIGKRVAVFPLIPCMKCFSCVSEDYQLCESYSYLGSRCNGGFAEYVAVPKWNIQVIPDTISFEVAAMFEPISVAIHALRLSGIYSGKNILITGTGTIASILGNLAVYGGANKVVILGRNQKKLEFLINQNPKIEIVNITENKYVEELKLLINNQADIVIEATGSSAMIEKSIELTCRHGTIVFVGNPDHNVEIKKEVFGQILRKELSIKGAWNSTFGNKKSDWENTLRFISSNKINLDSLITHKLPLEKLREGIEIMRNKDIVSNKVMVILNDK